MIQSIKKIRFSFLSFLLIMVFAVVSCDTEDASIVDVESFTDSSIEQLQSKVVGINHCLEFVFPITIEFIDGSTAVTTDYENLHETVVEYFTVNEIEKTRENKPTLIFPIEVINQEGEVIQVETEEDLKELKSECPREGRGKKGKRGKGFQCFDLVFPISVIIDGESISFEDLENLKLAIKTYKETAGDDAERPELVFPLSVEYEDGTVTEVDSKETLKDLKEACKDN